MKTCTVCGRSLPLSSFAKKRKGLQPKCRECSNRHNREWYAANREARRVHDRAYNLRKAYGLTLEAFDQLWSRAEGRCETCGGQLRPGRNGHAVDHDHSTGEVRGLLCPSCNLAIGKMRDDPAIARRIASYLERFRRSAEGENAREAA